MTADPTTWLRGQGRAAQRVATAISTPEVHSCFPSFGDPCGNCHRCTPPDTETSPRMAKGFVWSDLVNEMHRDHERGLT